MSQTASEMYVIMLKIPAKIMGGHRAPFRYVSDDQA